MAALGLRGAAQRGVALRSEGWRVPGVCQAAQQRVPLRPVAPELAPRSMTSSTTMTVMCSSLRKERKKMAKVLKSSRKALEKRLQAVTHADADSPVLSDLLMELRTLNERLAGQRAAALLYAADDSSDSSSDSDAEDCNVRPGALFQACAVRPATKASLPSRTLNAMPATPASVPTPASIATGSSSSSSVSTTMVVSGRDGVVEVAVPEPPAGWDWDEAEFRGLAFEGSGRVMMCTGSKCQRKGATELLSAVSALAAGSPGVEVVPCKCVGACSKGAAMRVRQQGQRCAVYTQLTPQQLPGIFAQHFEQQQGSGDQEARVASREAAPAMAVVEAGAVGVERHQHQHNGQVVRSGAVGEDGDGDVCAVPSVAREAEPCCVECHSFSLVEH